MKAKDIVKGQKYIAKVSGKLATVRVEDIREQFAFGKWRTAYEVTNIGTGRTLMFRSAARFRQASPLQRLG